MKTPKPETSRFLMQATLGFDQALLDAVSARGTLDWLDDQLAARPPEPRPFEPATRALWDRFKDRLTRAHGAAALNGEGNNPALPYKWYFRMAWWQHCLTRDDDLLRQRVALALSELLVVSDASALELDAVGMASYYDLLYANAFGSYADLLQNVALHPMMGIYLSHMGNQKAVPAQNLHPDENFAREIMQLFTIGLFELNPDGSEKRDAAGQPIPTYDNRDIKQLARVFTGLLPATYRYEWETSWWSRDYNGHPVGFDDGIETAYKTVPFIDATRAMVVDEDYHDRAPKSLLGGRVTLPGGQDGVEEIRSAVRQLVAHPSTAPFVARHLINRLVSSNPAPAYVAHVAAAFGPKGDLGAAVRAILTWPMSRPVADQVLPGSRSEEGRVVQSQRLKSPIERVTQLLRAFRAGNDSGKPWILGDDLQAALGMHPLSAPTVFNFYKPGFAPHGALQKRGLKAPEFELHTSASSVAYVNMMYEWFFGGYLPLVSTVIGSGPEQRMVMEMDPETLWANTPDVLRLDLGDAIAEAADPARHDALIDRLSVLLTGRTDATARKRIRAAFASYADAPEWVVQTIAFMIAISPEFTVQEA